MQKKRAAPVKTRKFRFFATDAVHATFKISKAGGLRIFYSQRTRRRQKHRMRKEARNKKTRSKRAGSSGGHGARTRNPLRGTSFPMRPLTIRLSSKRSIHVVIIHGTPNSSSAKIANFLKFSAKYRPQSFAVFSKVSRPVRRAGKIWKIPLYSFRKNG